MNLPDVKIKVESFNLNQIVALDDGIAGIIVKDVITGSTKTINTPFKVESFQEFTALKFDKTANAKVYKVVKEFYDEKGGTLYIMVTDQDLVNMTDKSKANSVKKLIDFSNGAIKICGVYGKETFIAGDYNTTGDKCLPKESLTAVNNLQALALDYVNEKTPVTFVLAGNGVKVSQVLNLSNITDKTYVSLFVGNDVTGTKTALGILMGSLSKLPVQRKISRVKNGSTTLSSAFLGTVELTYNLSAVKDFATKGVITFRKFPNKAGIFFSMDSTLADASNDLNTISKNRVIQKAIRIANSVFDQEIDTDIVLTSIGTLPIITASIYENNLNIQLDNLMRNTGEISQRSVSVDTTNNIVNTGQIKVSVTIVPVGYASGITIVLGFKANI